MEITSSPINLSENSAFQTHRNATLAFATFIREANQQGEKFKTTAWREYPANAVSLSFLAVMSEYKCTDLTKEAPDINRSFCQNTMYFSSHDMKLYGFIYVLNLCCNQVPIICLDFLLLDTLLWPEAEKRIRLGVLHLSLENRFSVLSKKAASRFQASGSSSSILSDAPFERDTCSSEDSKAIQSAMF